MDETQTADPPERARAGALSYLLLIHGSSSCRVFLPRDGIVVVGRDPTADVCIDDVAISRRHAKFIASGDGVRVSDLDSHNGTRVNGERIDGSRTIASGDVIAIGDATFVLRSEACAPCQAVDAGRLRQRIVQEIDRAIAYGRPLALVAVELGDVGPGDREKAGTAATAAVRRMDGVGWGSPTQLVAVLPELAGGAARASASDILKAVQASARGVKAGLAACPADGRDADTLLSGARAAAEIAEPGKVAAAAETAVRYTVGERTVLAADPAMMRLFDLIRRLAVSDLPVLVLGETGAGKENAASAVHFWSQRAPAPLITFNCATVPETLVDDELFGHVKGAFFGAKADKPGLFERANGGTMFFDEVGELPAGTQAKLLRVLDVKRLTRLGDVREREIDVRVVAATNRDLDAECRAGRFRQDLLFRLNAAKVNLPPLRHRPREVPILARMFLADACARNGRPALDLSDAVLRRLAAYDWPGNVRELKNVIEYAVATLDGDAIQLWHLPSAVAGRMGAEPLPSGTKSGVNPDPDPGAPAPQTPGAPPKRRFLPIAEEITQLERTRIQEALDASGGIQHSAADLIDMPLRTFVLKLKQYGLQARDTKRS
jgi:DNA-binding NtrC family response regulator